MLLLRSGSRVARSHRRIRLPHSRARGIHARNQLRCLFLGDSYTAGTAVPEKLRWPVQLTSLKPDLGRDAEAPRFIAGNGWTTEDLLTAMDEENPLPHFDLVFLMIGVNNQFHGRPFAEFQTQFRLLFDRAIGLAQGRPSQVLVLAIPDYSVTPFAADRIPAAIASDIDRYNNECRAIAKSSVSSFWILRRSRARQGFVRSCWSRTACIPRRKCIGYGASSFSMTIKRRF